MPWPTAWSTRSSRAANFIQWSPCPHSVRRVDRPPSVDKLARSLADTGLPHPLLVDAARAAIAAGDPDRARTNAESIRAALLQPVINATGVLLHTNLGRAPLGVSHPEAYTNLE